MEVILNIGLHSETLGVIPAQKALSEVRKAFGVHFNAAVIQSDTEPTLVCEVHVDPIRASNKIYELAVLLGQDCIGAYTPASGVGILIGPKPWGAFNPEFFILPNGTRLATPAAKAA